MERDKILEEAVEFYRHYFRSMFVQRGVMIARLRGHIMICDTTVSREENAKITSEVLVRVGPHDIFRDRAFTYIVYYGFMAAILNIGLPLWFGITHIYDAIFYGSESKIMHEAVRYAIRVNLKRYPRKTEEERAVFAKVCRRIVDNYPIASEPELSKIILGLEENTDRVSFYEYCIRNLKMKTLPMPRIIPLVVVAAITLIVLMF